MTVGELLEALENLPKEFLIGCASPNPGGAEINEIVVTPREENGATQRVVLKGGF